MKISVFIALLLAVVLVVVLFSSAYVVPEWGQAVVTQFGKPVGEPVTEPGLHWKTPFVQRVIFFQKRILEWDGDARETLTANKEKIMVNTFARWRIIKPLRFYKALRTVNNGQGVLDEQIGSAVQKVIKVHHLAEVIRDTSRELKYMTTELGDSTREKEVAIRIGRSNIIAKIKKLAEVDLIEKYGIELVDVQIKQINYLPVTRDSIYNRMISERVRIKVRYESEGQKQKERIEGEVLKEKAKLESEGYRIAKEIRGDADREATRIYAEAYGRDPDFYGFMKTLETYELIFNRNTHLILSTDSEFFKYLKGITPKK